MAWRLTDDEAMAAYDSVIDVTYHFDHKPTFEEARDAVIKMRLQAVTQEQVRKVVKMLEAVGGPHYEEDQLPDKDEPWCFGCDWDEVQSLRKEAGL